MTRNMKAEYSIEEPITLVDLRWLVAQCVGLPGNSHVRVTEHKSYAPNDYEKGKITVFGVVTEPE